MPSGGIERVISTLANNFSEKYEITILVKDKPASFYPLNKNIKIISLDNDLIFDMGSKFNRILSATKSLITSVKLLKKFFKTTSYDYYYIAHPLNALEFHLAKGFDNKNTIMTEHGAPDAYNIVYKKIKSWLYPKSKVFIVPTTSDTSLYKSMGLPAFYIPHFKSNLNYIKSNLDSKIALNIGRFTEAKRQWILIDIWGEIVNKHKITDWKLYLVGQGELEGPFKEKIKTLCLENYVFLKPTLAQVEDYYKDSSLFLLTSNSEGFGMVLLEAISFGIPCISFDCPSGPRDIVKDSLNGYLIEHNNCNSFEKKLLQLIRDPALLNEFGLNSFEISKLWSDELILEKWIHILET